jgi:PTH1 family peptidyl-tRNA hydrolase
MRVALRDVLLVKPDTFMNESGLCVARLRRRKGLQDTEVLLVVDDVDLPLGRLRLRPHGGAGGHNGLGSVLRETGSEGFPRLRIGVGTRPPGEDLVRFVLGRFAPDERDTIRTAIETAADAVMSVVDEGMDAAMNRYNA